MTTVHTPHLTNRFILRMISVMNKAGDKKTQLRVLARTLRALPLHSVGGWVLALLVGIALASCASPPEYPAMPPPTTKVLPSSFQETFDAARSVLDEDQRLVLHTVDNAGRFVVWEKTGGFIFFQHRTILDIRLEPVGPEETKVTMRLSAEKYEMGGLTRPADWYPSSDVDTFLGEDIMDLIEKEIAGLSR